MYSAIRRVVVVLASVAAIAAAGAGGIRAAEPELGATVEANVYTDEDPRLTVWNRSNVEARFELLPSGGWTVDPAVLVLRPDERREVAVGGAGDDGATVAVIARSVAPAPPGRSESVVRLEARVYHARPLDAAQLVLGILAALAVVLVVARGLVALRRVASRYAIVRRDPAA